jgi:hypothetical protein
MKTTATHNDDDNDDNNNNNLVHWLKYLKRAVKPNIKKRYRIIIKISENL